MQSKKISQNISKRILLAIIIIGVAISFTLFSAFIPPIPPLINVVKVPDPLLLPNGPGAVNYTYALRNFGEVPVTNVTMFDDTCDSVKLISGDSNSDAILDINEKWVYSCSTSIFATHTGTVTTTGWANGLSTTDVASSTVVVGIPVTPPLIHITKVPNPVTFLVGGGTVTYTNKVTNPGIVPLNNIHISDNKCGPVKYISGDTNIDQKLDLSETWTYTCQANIIGTTTSAVAATGEANGLTAADIALATVVVAADIPIIHNTGISPSLLNILVIAGILILVSTSIVIVLKKPKT